jgi:hypothetical protein
MIRILVLLSALLSLPMAGRSQDKQAVLLAEAFGASAGGFCFDVYCALSDLEAIAKAGGKEKVLPEHVGRHIKAISILSNYTKKLRPAFTDDKTFIETITKFEQMITALVEQGEALNTYLESGTDDAFKNAHAKKEASRELLIRLLSIPENANRKSVP